MSCHCPTVAERQVLMSPANYGNKNSLFGEDPGVWQFVEEAA